MSAAMVSKRIAIVGFGGIGSQLATIVRRSSLAKIAAILVKAEAAADFAAKFPDLPFVSHIQEVLDSRPDIVIECANARVLSEIALPILRTGCSLVAASASALADNDLYAEVKLAAERYKGSLLVPAGAIGSTDALAAMRLSGFERVTYRGIKPPEAWRGTRAEALCPLFSLQKSTTFFLGTARQAAIEFPLNANVAATIGIASAGLDNTAVELVAEPGADKNRHEIEALGPSGSISFRAMWQPSTRNPRTSSIIPYSILASALRGEGAVHIT